MCNPGKNYVSREEWLKQIPEMFKDSQPCKYFVIMRFKDGSWRVSTFDEYPNLANVIKPDEGIKILTAKEEAMRRYETVKHDPQVVECYLAENIYHK